MGDLNAMFKKNRVCDEIITRLSRFITFTTDTEKVRTVRGLVITAGAESHQLHQGDTRAVCPLGTIWAHGTVQFFVIEHLLIL